MRRRDWFDWMALLAYFIAGVLICVSLSGLVRAAMKGDLIAIGILVLSGFMVMEVVFIWKRKS